MRDPLARWRSEYAMRNKRAEGAGLQPTSRSGRVARRVGRRGTPRCSTTTSAPSTSSWCRGLGLTTDAPRHLASGGEGRIASADVEVNGVVEALVRELYERDYEAFGYA